MDKAPSQKKVRRKKRLSVGRCENQKPSIQRNIRTTVRCSPVKVSVLNLINEDSPQEGLLKKDDLELSKPLETIHNPNIATSVAQLCDKRIVSVEITLKDRLAAEVYQKKEDFQETVRKLQKMCSEDSILADESCRETAVALGRVVSKLAIAGSTDQGSESENSSKGSKSLKNPRGGFKSACVGHGMPSQCFIPGCQSLLSIGESLIEESRHMACWSSVLMNTTLESSTSSSRSNIHLEDCLRQSYKQPIVELKKVQGEDCQAEKPVTQVKESLPVCVPKSCSTMNPRGKPYLHTVQGNQLPMSTPNSLGQSTIIKSSIKCTNPLKVDIKTASILSIHMHFTQAFFVFVSFE
ncbi:inner centromere protein-like [Erpetoichthys calabaricus]|uniref:inner centromere protein-like n=1 Tax=Erpetoichthys calabaricus TaxID=27687 RepID=UPI002234A5C6|nr:inner centromere protein-like [Erpetoichthys calabaricus]